MAISMLKIRRPLGRLIFNMGIAIPGKTVFLIEMAPRMVCQWQSSCKLHNRHLWSISPHRSLVLSNMVMTRRKFFGVFTGGSFISWVCFTSLSCLFHEMPIYRAQIFAVKIVGFSNMRYCTWPFCRCCHQSHCIHRGSSTSFCEA